MKRELPMHCIFFEVDQVWNTFCTSLLSCAMTSWRAISCSFRSKMESQNGFFVPCSLYKFIKNSTGLCNLVCLRESQVLWNSELWYPKAMNAVVSLSKRKLKSIYKINLLAESRHVHIRTPSFNIIYDFLVLRFFKINSLTSPSIMISEYLQGFWNFVQIVFRKPVNTTCWHCWFFFVWFEFDATRAKQAERPIISLIQNEATRGEKFKIWRRPWVDLSPCQNRSLQVNVSYFATFLVLKFLL